MKNKTKKILLKIIFGLGILVIIFSAGFIVYEKTINKSLSSWNNKIYYGISIGGIDVGGKTEEEAIMAVKSQLVDSLDHKGLTINVNDSNFYYTYSDFNLDYGVENAVDKAIKYGKNFSTEEKLNLINTQSNIDYDICLEISPDMDKMKEKYEYIKGKVNQEPENARINVTGNNVNIIKEINGISLDEDQFNSEVSKCFDDTVGITTEVSVTADRKEPDLKAADLEKIKDYMAGYTTDYSSAEVNTAYNIELAAEAINNKLLMPGEEFSFNNTVKSDKYKDGSVKKGEDTINNYAQGISQVSSTLYRCVTRANLQTLERHKDNLSSFQDVGYEAAISFDSDDYKFKNTYDFPIYIQTIVQNEKLTVNIYGDKSALEGKEYDLSSEVVSKKDQQVTYKDDTELNIGTEVVEYEGRPECTINAYKVIMQNGSVIDKELLSEDKYDSINCIKKRGTKIVSATQPNNPDNTGNTNNPADTGNVNSQISK